MKTLKIKSNGQTIDLNQNHFLAGGGEGEIYVKGGYAYKVYHDPKKMIPVQKVQELAKINLPNVLGPLHSITDSSGQAIGFSMRYVDKTEYLCKLFTKGFRDQHGVNPAMINALVHSMQDTLNYIHTQDILCVDLNELNFLVSNDFQLPYFIDVDSYQTEHYPATAIMDSIRDPKVQHNAFTVGSDWFSMAIIFFQLYMGTHPYKGRHPDFGKDWQTMMKNGISVFNKKVRMPPNVQDWSVVPKGHLKWFERVFEHGERISPPNPDVVDAMAGAVKPQIVASTSKFSLSLVRTYDSVVKAIRCINGITYAYTEKSIYAQDRAIQAHSQQVGFTAKRARFDFVHAQNDLPVVIEFNSLLGELNWRALSGKGEGEMKASGCFVANGKLYTSSNGYLIENTFSNLGAGKVIVSQIIAGNIFQARTESEGIICQDMLGTCNIAIPGPKSGAFNIRVRELDKNRILSSQYKDGVAIVLHEQGGKINRSVFCFDKSLKTYNVRTEPANLQDIQFVVLDKGLVVAANDDTIELFFDNSKVKVVDDSPITGGQRLYTIGNEIFLVNRNELHKVAML